MRNTWIQAAVVTASLATISANAAEPTPAFPGQTGAPRVSSPAAPKVRVVASGLNGAWSIAFLPEDKVLVSFVEGLLRVVYPNGFVSAPLAGMPPVKQVAAEGLHDVVLDPDFASNRKIYFAYTAPPPGEPAGRWPSSSHWYEDVWTLPLPERLKKSLGMEVVSSATLSKDLTRVTDVTKLVEGADRRIVMGPNNTLFATGADRFRFYDTDIDGVDHDFTATPDVRRNYSGVVLRANRDGSIPKDNPWLSRTSVAPATFAHGLRDPEGAAINPATGDLWTVEHGPQGGDELNIIRAGKDYGWPDVSYGTQYDARQTGGRTSVPVGSGKHSRADVEEPRYFWFPSIAPSGMMFYTGNQFPQWKGNLFVGAMSATSQSQALFRMVLDGDKIVGEERLLEDRKQRIRDVRQAPDGSVYVLAGDQLLQLTPGSN
jgi:aldose sugar dehydrogenase